MSTASKENTTIPFGKHRGKTFKEVAEDKGYCEWCMSIPNPSGVMKDFCDYLRCSGQYQGLPPPAAATKRLSLPVASEGSAVVPQQTGWTTSAGRNPPAVLPQSVSSPDPGSQISAIPIDHGIGLEIVEKDRFRIVSCQAKGGGRRFVSSYLPSEIFRFVQRYAPGRYSANGKEFLAFGGDVYSRVVQEMPKNFMMKEWSVVPNFVLRAFEAFREAAPALKLQKKCAHVLLGMTSPRTLESVQSLTSSLGKELTRGLRKFQIEGLDFALKRNGRVLIGDEMGLGKTLQALAVVAVYSKEWPVLIVTPSSVKFQWRDQIKRWLGHLLSEPDKQVVTIRSGKDNISEDAKLVIISYDLLSKNEKFQRDFKIVIVDESHYLKTITAKRTKLIIPLLQRSRRAILLSGTPALNKPSELFQQLDALLPNFSRYTEFSDRYCEKKLNPWSKKMEYYGCRNHEELYLFLTSTVMIRRLKKDVQKELPPKVRSRIPLEIEAKHMKDVTRKMEELKSFGNSVEQDLMSSGTATVGGDGRDDQVQGRTLITELFNLTAAAKKNAAGEYIKYLIQNNIKFITFGHHMEMLDHLEEVLIGEKVNYIRIDGKVSQEQREKRVKKFMGEEDCKVAILSITACGTGLNLTAAGTVVFAELYWVPGQMIQAEDRCHRMGTQFCTVDIHYLIAEGTVDDMIWKMMSKKWQGVTSSLDGAGQDFEATSLGRQKLSADAVATFAQHASPQKERRVVRRGSIDILQSDSEDEQENNKRRTSTECPATQLKISSFFSQKDRSTISEGSGLSEAPSLDIFCDDQMSNRRKRPQPEGGHDSMRLHEKKIAPSEIDDLFNDLNIADFD